MCKVCKRPVRVVSRRISKHESSLHVQCPNSGATYSPHKVMLNVTAPGPGTANQRSEPASVVEKRGPTHTTKKSRTKGRRTKTKSSRGPQGGPIVRCPRCEQPVEAFNGTKVNHHQPQGGRCPESGRPAYRKEIIKAPKRQKPNANRKTGKSKGQGTTANQVADTSRAPSPPVKKNAQGVAKRLFRF